MYNLYVITHRESGKSYVGFTNNIFRRWKDHKKAELDTHFCRALRKYGPDAFDWEVVEKHETREQAVEAEIFMIAYLRSLGAELYNMTKGGDGGGWCKTIWVGRKHKLETREKQSQSSIKRFQDPVQRQQHSLSAKKRWAKLSSEQRKEAWHRSRKKV